MFEQFPYTNFHELNLDWILQKIKEAYSPENPPQNVVLSVDGQTGNVRVFPDAIVTLPEVTEGTWNIHRISGGQSSGIQFTPNRAERIEGTNRYEMYDEGNPPPYPVQSVNGQTGAVTITIPVQSVNGETGAIILYQDASTRLPNVAENVWNIYRISNGTERGIQFTPNGMERIEGTNRYEIFDEGHPPAYPVTSVNGQTGNVVIPKVITDLSAEMLNINTASPENYWGLIRQVSTGTASIYLDTSNNTVKAYISYVSSDEQTTVTLPLLTSADIPSSSGVLSINGLTGAVTLYGTNIYRDSNSNKTIDQAIAENTSAISTETNRAQGQEGVLAGRITTAEQQNTAQNTSITALEKGIAIIVTGDTATAAVPAGGYAYLKNNNHGLAEGLYVNTSGSAFPATGGTADSSVFTADPDGALNALNSNLSPLITGKTWAEYVQPTLVNGSQYSGGCRYGKFGAFVHVYISAQFDSAPSNALLWTMPSGFIPVGEVQLAASGGGSYNAKAQAIINSSGEVRVTSVDKWVSASGIYFVTI